MELVLDGEIEITLEGRTEVARKGDIAVIPPYKVHSFHTPEYVKQVIFVFSDNFIPGDISFEQLCTKRERHVFTPSDALSGYIEASGFRECGGLYDPIKDKLLIQCRKATINLILTEYFTVASPIPDNITYNTLSKILIYMTEHFNEDLSLNSMGSALGYSPKYISNCLSALGGFGFRRILNSIRVEKAKQMLRSEEDTVIKIAMDCGFASQSSFHQVFKDIAGITPAEYRRRGAER